AFVVGGRVIGAIERSAAGWKTNLARGGSARATTLSAERAALAVRAAQAVGAEYAGVDLLPARDGTDYVVEVNGIPGWRGLQEATSIDVAATIVTHLLGPWSPRGAGRRARRGPRPRGTPLPCGGGRPPSRPPGPPPPLPPRGPTRPPWRA